MLLLLLLLVLVQCTSKVFSLRPNRAVTGGAAGQSVLSEGRRPGVKTRAARTGTGDWLRQKIRDEDCCCLSLKANAHTHTHLVATLTRPALVVVKRRAAERECLPGRQKHIYKERERERREREILRGKDGEQCCTAAPPLISNWRRAPV